MLLNLLYNNAIGNSLGRYGERKEIHPFRMPIVHQLSNSGPEFYLTFLMLP
jgi:hypothetical protein